jgi:hypothetical protein
VRYIATTGWQWGLQIQSTHQKSKADESEYCAAFAKLVRIVWAIRDAKGLPDVRHISFGINRLDLKMVSSTLFGCLTLC